MSGVPTSSSTELSASSLPEEVRSAFDYLPAHLAGNLAGISVILMIFWSTTPASVVLPWLSAFAVMWLARLWLLRRFKLASPLTVTDWQRWRS